MKTEIIIYENHILYSDFFRCFLEKNGYNKDFTYQSVVNLCEIENLLSQKPSILVMNIVGQNAAELMEKVEYLISKDQKLKVIIISSNAEVRMVKKFFEKGIKSFLTKNTTGEEFLLALQEVIVGKVYISDEIKNALFNYMCNATEEQEKKRYGIEELTSREKDVLLKICDGLRTKEIADKLFISTHTVESHRRNIMMKLDVHNTSMLVKFAMDHQLVT